MATFTFTGQLFDITFNNQDRARRLSAEPATLVIETSGDEGFFVYRIEEREGELPDIDVVRSNITAVTVNGFDVLDDDDVEASFGQITFSGGTTQLLAFAADSEDDNREDLAIFSLDGAQLPTLNSAAAFNNFVSGASFSDGGGAFAPGARIVLNDLDRADFESGVPVQSGTSGADVIIGDGGADNIEAGGGNDSVDGGAGNDTISGGGGADTITGGGGSDEISGGGGRDDLNGGGGRDTIQGGGGRDKLVGGGGADELIGGGGRDFLDGKGGRDSLDGGGGRDSLVGGGGRDTLDGGRGNDVLTGGRGPDIFEFARGSGRDTITDYNDRQDRFSIGGGADEFDDLTITQQGGNALIRFANVRITVEDTDASVLGENDFIFT